MNTNKRYLLIGFAIGMVCMLFVGLTAAAIPFNTPNKPIRVYFYNDTTSLAPYQVAISTGRNATTDKPYEAGEQTWLYYINDNRTDQGYFGQTWYSYSGHLDISILYSNGTNLTQFPTSNVTLPNLSLLETLSANRYDVAYAWNNETQTWSLQGVSVS